MLLPSLAIFLGLAALIWSADRFVIGAAACANNLSISPLLIGLTIVAFGTSAPEIFVAYMASIEGVGQLAIGNALGSNIANIGLVLGITAIFVRLPISNNVLKKEIPLLLLVTLLAGALLLDLKLTLIDSLLLLGLLIIGLIAFHRFQKNEVNDETETDEELPKLTQSWAYFWIALGLICLIASSKFLVWGATEVALHFGVSELIIGLTIIAIGTSLPELATSISSALKGHTDMVIGNLVGSNLFNIAAVMAVPGLISPIALSPEVLIRDYAVILAFSAALLIFGYSKAKAVTGLGGTLLSLLYAAYLFLLYNISI